jgi:hypothetical protein
LSLIAELSDVMDGTSRPFSKGASPSFSKGTRAIERGQNRKTHSRNGEILVTSKDPIDANTFTVNIRGGGWCRHPASSVRAQPLMHTPYIPLLITLMHLDGPSADRHDVLQIPNH